MRREWPGSHDAVGPSLTPVLTFYRKVDDDLTSLVLETHDPFLRLSRKHISSIPAFIALSTDVGLTPN